MDVRYTLSITNPAQHLLDVAITVSGIDTEQLDFVLPTWTPGSYLIREYARHVQNVSIDGSSGAPTWRKIDKQTWRVTTSGADRISLRYQVYGNELSVRTNHVDDTHAHVIPAATCMFVVGATDQPLRVAIEQIPQEWQIATGLPAIDDHLYEAQDFDHLVDSPFEIGIHRSLSFEVDGKPHRLVIWGRGNEDEARLISDTRRIVEQARDLFGGLPYDDYTFLLMLTDNGGGGLEHRNSTSLLLPRWIFQPERSYERFLTLVSHEFFHVWNVKRIRAEALGPFDYTREAYTTLLWAMEGVTEYYTDLQLVRAGLITPQRYLERLADDIVTLQGTPGRQLQSLECASFDAWIKHYRPDENTPNTAVSYYLKGAIVAALLDLEIRRRTGNAHSLDDVLRHLFAAYPIDGPGIPERDGYLAAITEATGQDLSDFFERYIGGTDELPYDEVFDAAGLKLQWQHKDTAPDGSARPTLGIRTKRDGGQLRVATVLRGGPAYDAGVNANDEIVALDGSRVTDENELRDRLHDHKPDQRVTLTLFRRGEQRAIDVPLAAAPHDNLTITPIEQPNDTQQHIYRDWLHTS